MYAKFERDQTIPSMFSRDNKVPNEINKQIVKRIIKDSHVGIWLTRATFEMPKYPRRPRDQYTAQIVNTLALSAPPPNQGLKKKTSSIL